MQVISSQDENLDERQKKFAAIAMETREAVLTITDAMTVKHSDGGFVAGMVAMAIITGVGSAAGRLAAQLDRILGNGDQRAGEVLLNQVSTSYEQEAGSGSPPDAVGNADAEEQHAAECPHCQGMKDAASEWSQKLFGQIMDMAREAQGRGGIIPATEMDPLLFGTADALGQVLGGIGAEDDIVQRVAGQVVASREHAMRNSVAGNA